MYKLLSIKLAEEIVHQTMMRLHHNINVISNDGVILASGDKERVDSIHEGAIQVAKTGRPLYIDENLAKEFYNCKPGINLPIKYHEKIIGVIGITGDPNELKEIANLVQLTTEMMVHQVITESKSEWRRKNGDFIFKALIENVLIDSSVQERIQKLPFPLDGPYLIILIKQMKDATSNTLTLNIENILYRQPALFGQLNLNEYYLLLCGSTVKNSKEILKQIIKFQKKFDIHIGVGPIVDNLEELPYAFTSAKTALTFSDKYQHTTYFEDVEIFTLFKGRKSYEINKFITKVQGLTEKLTETLTSYFESNLQLNICSEKLGIHRHTLTYRLNKIHEITGYNPQTFEDAFVLKLALTLCKQR
ncbi:CdaR family transcriptional regulator [Ureibacillus acetophenoni]|uniref:CdaR family transcriptional regulator n=1 Tax=Ureibacillus acetophenoni TaxID=614649 RepID=A0A285US74_9BACL|nr:CdaR family transcriptional regulator [Ureibacillus acetophenoni]